MNAALPAAEPLSNSVKPPNAPLNEAPLFVMRVNVPAVDMLLNMIAPSPPDPSTAVTNSWRCPELLVMPVQLSPLGVGVTPGLTVMVREFVWDTVKLIAASEFAGVAVIKSEVTSDKASNVAVSPTLVPG